MNAIYKDNSEGSDAVSWEHHSVAVRKEHNTDIYQIFNSPILTNWGWTIAFFVICTFNGWMLNLSSASLFLVIYFTVFPLGASVYVFSRNTKVLVISLMTSQMILALSICSLSPINSIIPVVFGSINLLFFAFILTNVARENNVAIISVLILCSTLILLTSFGWEWIGRIVWYCNLTFTANKAEKKMRQFIDDFDSTMLALCVISALGLAVGWGFAGISP